MSLIEEFHKCHDPSGPYIVENGWVYWPDGSRRESSAYGIMIDPPANDDHQLALYQRQYWQLLTTRKINEFNELKNALRSQARAAQTAGAYPPTAQDLERLKSLKSEVDSANAKLAEANEKVEATIPTEVKQRREAAEERVRAGGEFLDALEKVEI